MTVMLFVPGGTWLQASGGEMVVQQYFWGIAAPMVNAALRTVSSMIMAASRWSFPILGKIVTQFSKDWKTMAAHIRLIPRGMPL